MQVRDTHKSFGVVSIFLHWATAFVVLTLLGTGLYSLYFLWFVTGERAGYGWFNMNLHIYIGALAIPLIAWRIYWRVKSGHPEELKQHRVLEWITSVNWPLILILIVFCFVTGIYLVWLHGNALEIYFGIPLHPVMWPRSVPEMYDLHSNIILPLHIWASLVLGFVLGMHICGALKHWLIDRDRTLARMIRPQELGPKAIAPSSKAAKHADAPAE